MERVGEITAVDKGWLEVTFCRMTDCGECHACMGGEKKQTSVRVRGEGNVGDGAVIILPTSTVMKASASAYIIPLIGLLAGMMVGQAVVGGDGPAALGALIGLLLSLVALGVTEKRRRTDPRWNPVLKEVLPRADYLDIPKGVMNHGK